jgi:hypothetical protein
MQDKSVDRLMFAMFTVGMVAAIITIFVILLAAIQQWRAL